MEKFVANSDFFSQEFQSQYSTGLTYTIRPQDSLLNRLVKEVWMPAGLVSLVDEAARPISKMRGIGTVTDTPVKGGIFKRIKSWL